MKPCQRINRHDETKQLAQCSKSKTSRPKARKDYIVVFSWGKANILQCLCGGLSGKRTRNVVRADSRACTRVVPVRPLWFDRQLAFLYQTSGGPAAHRQERQRLRRGRRQKVAFLLWDGIANIIINDDDDDDDDDDVKLDTSYT
eukprot:915609-Amphidinium_carterae.1